MKSFFLGFLSLASMGVSAQTANWDVHPLNMIPCQEWIYPEPGCGGCSSCRSSIDSHPAVMDGGALQWSQDLVMCPHPVDTQGNNAVIISDWPVQPDPSAYIYGSVIFFEPMRIDTLDLTCAAWSPGTDSVDLAIQFNETDPLTTTHLLRGALSGNYAHYVVTDIGPVPMNGNGIAQVNFFVRTHGTDVWLLFKGMRVVASADQTASISETAGRDVFILPESNGVRISAREPLAVSICDAAGRTTCSRTITAGSTYFPLADGLSIVRAGTEVKRIVR